MKKKVDRIASLLLERAEEKGLPLDQVMRGVRRGEGSKLPIEEWELAVQIAAMYNALE